MEYKTKQKEMIISLLKSNKELSLSAKEILDKLDGSVSKATLYRALEKLEEEKIIRKCFNEFTSSYEYQFANKEDKCSSHLHLKCKNCGRLIHLHCGESNSFISHIAKEHNFYVNQNDTMIYGLCSNCSIIKRGL